VTSIFTEDLDRARIDLNEAERRAFKAEHAQREAEKARRGVQERADTLERQLRDALERSDQDHKACIQLRQQVDRLQSLEPELSQARSELRDANDRSNRYVDQNEELERKLEAAKAALHEKKAECAMLTAELDPTRALLSYLHDYLAAERGMRKQIEVLFG